MIASGYALVFAFSAAFAAADEPAARAAPFHNYKKAVELTHGKARAVIAPEGGGRVLVFSIDGKDALYLDDAEQKWEPGKPSPASAGRFDFGPELTVTPHPKIWGGDWTAEIVGDAVKLTSPREDAAGMQLTREFKFVVEGKSIGLACKQTMINIGKEPREVCHWGRSFSPGGGICVVPLGDKPSRFPSKYAMYEDGGAVINVRDKDDLIRERDGCLEILAPPRKPKLGFDTYAGWLAYAMPNNTLFVKRFAAFPDRVYNEAAGLTLSVWYPTGPRIELEPIGPRERLKPGEFASFTETWWLLAHPFPAKGEQLDLKALREKVLRDTTESK